MYDETNTRDWIDALVAGGLLYEIQGQDSEGRRFGVTPLGERLLSLAEQITLLTRSGAWDPSVREWSQN